MKVILCLVEFSNVCVNIVHRLILKKWLRPSNTCNHLNNYFPDFLVNGNFYEIKGGQFFNEAGEPYNPYSKSYWWEKYNAMVEAGVHILREKDIKEYLTYVKDTYGENYLKSFKIKRGS